MDYVVKNKSKGYRPVSTSVAKALIANPAALEAWNDITPLARDEFICWVDDAKQKTTRERRIRRIQEELEEASVGRAAGRGGATANAPASRSGARATIGSTVAPAVLLPMASTSTSCQRLTRYTRPGTSSRAT